jgi:hypothetical protein
VCTDDAGCSADGGKPGLVWSPEAGEGVLYDWEYDVHMPWAESCNVRSYGYTYGVFMGYETWEWQWMEVYVYPDFWDFDQGRWVEMDEYSNRYQHWGVGTGSYFLLIHGYLYNAPIGYYKARSWHRIWDMWGTCYSCMDHELAEKWHETDGWEWVEREWEASALKYTSDPYRDGSCVSAWASTQATCTACCSPDLGVHTYGWLFKWTGSETELVASSHDDGQIPPNPTTVSTETTNCTEPTSGWYYFQSCHIVESVSEYQVNPGGWVWID